MHFLSCLQISRTEARSISPVKLFSLFPDVIYGAENRTHTHTHKERERGGGVIKQEELKIQLVFHSLPKERWSTFFLLNETNPIDGSETSSRLLPHHPGPDGISRFRSVCPIAASRLPRNTRSTSAKERTKLPILLLRIILLLLH